MSIQLNVHRIAAQLGTALVLVLTGCGEMPQQGDGTVKAETITCPAKVDAWAIGTPYKVGDLVGFKGAVFACRQAHTPVDGWFPDVVQALWNPVQCTNGDPVQEAPPAQQPPPGQQQPPVVQQPAPPNGTFPALLDNRFFQLKLSATPNAPSNSAPIFDVVSAVGAAGVADLQQFVDSAKVSIQGTTETRTNGAFTSTQTFANGVQEGDVTVGGVKRLHFIRDFKSGSFKGILVGAGSDQSPPLCAIVTPTSGLDATHELVADVGNNLKNDIKAIATVNASSLVPSSTTFFLQSNGGLSDVGPGAPECPQLVRQFGMTGSVKGF
jgi:carbohydrate binding protein with CBM5/12 domain